MSTEHCRAEALETVPLMKINVVLTEVMYTPKHSPGSGIEREQN